MYRELFTCDKPCLRVGECMLFMEVLLHEIFEVLVEHDFHLRFKSCMKWV